MKHQNPPKWADRLLKWYCRKSLLEDLQGDLYEYFDRNVQKKGLRRARLIYILDVLKFFRLYTLQKPKFIRSMNSIALLSNYLKTSLRSIARNRLFSGINVFSMAASMSVCLLMIAFISDMLSFDRFHERGDRIYRLTSNFKDVNNDWDLASVPAILGEELQGYEEIEEVVSMRRGFYPDVFLETGEVFQLKGHWMSEGFSKVFTFPAIAGDVEKALSEPYSLVITESTAYKMFDNGDAIGQVVKIDDENFTIKAILEDPPKFSHLRFEVLGSFITHKNASLKEDEEEYRAWDNMWMYHAFVLLKEDATKASVDNILKSISESKADVIANIEVTIQMQAYTDIAFGKSYSNESGMSMESGTAWIVVVLTLVIILTASFNYTNLSIAKSLRRAKEIGVRKVVGATRANVFSQFIIEAIVISLFSLVIAIGFYVIIREEFLGFTDELSDLTNLQVTWYHIMLFIAFAIVVGFVSGFLPALVLSKLKAMLVLKDISKEKVFSAVNLRKVLIVVQFSISLIFIISATIIYNQYHFAISFDLGYETDNIINIQVNDPEKCEKLVTELEKVPEVQMISRSTLIQSTGNIYTTDIKYNDPMDSASVYYNGVDLNYIENFGHTFLAGGNFTHSRGEDDPEKEIVVDERFLERFQLGTPTEAIGEMVKINDNSLQIVGVVENFMYANLNHREQATVFRNMPNQFYQVNVKVNSQDPVVTMEKLQNAWRAIDEIHPFRAKFFDDQIQQSYVNYTIMMKIVGFMAFIAISVSLLGLLGMVVYQTETRIKEISIRKVLGASEQNLILILSRAFMYMLGIACLIAIPATYFFFENVYFAEKVHRINLGIMQFIGGVVVMFALGFVVVFWQTLKAARTNPATTLRNE